MKNQFYYIRKELIPPKEGETEAKYDVYPSSINVNKVVMTVLMEDGKLAIILDDYHERIEEIPTFNKQGKQTGTKNKHYTHQSTIYLSPEDAERFTKLTNIENV